jgi:flavin prenyltransferase
MMDTPPASPHRLILALTGASGIVMGVRALQLLHQTGVETHLVVSKSAALNLKIETDWEVDDLVRIASVSYAENNLSASIASGSFRTNGMLILPCSIKTLSAVANSYSNNLIVRAADVCLKEGRPLVLGVREAPLHMGHLRLMSLAARSGAIIYPAIPHFYGRPASLDDLIDGLVGRMLLRLGVDNPGYPRWGDSLPE